MFLLRTPSIDFSIFQMKLVPFQNGKHFAKTKPILKIYASPLIGLNLKYFEQKDALKDKQILKSLLKTF